MWVGASRATIATGLAEVLYDTLDADVVCVGLRASASGVACQGVSPATPREDALRDAICAAITAWCNRPDPDPKTINLPPTTNPCVVTPIGITGEHGVIATVVSRQHFPTDIHRLLLNVGANQATVAFWPARPAMRSGLPTHCSESAARSLLNSISRKSSRPSPMRRQPRVARISAPSFTTSSTLPANPTCCTRWPVRRGKRSPAFPCRAIRPFSGRRLTDPRSCACPT